MFYIRETNYIYNACESWENICFGIALIIKALKKDHCWRYRDQDACGILKATSKESKRAAKHSLHADRDTGPAPSCLAVLHAFERVYPVVDWRTIVMFANKHR